MTAKKHSKRRRNFENILRTLIDQIEQFYVDSPFDGYGNEEDAFDIGYRIPGFKITPESTERLNRAIAHLEEAREHLKATSRLESGRYHRFIRDNRPGVPVRKSKPTTAQSPEGQQS